MNGHDDDASSFNLEVFVIHLAAHLLGVSTIQSQLIVTKNGPFRLYWRSPILIEIGKEKLSCNIATPVFVDVVFEFGWNDDDDDDKNDATKIQMRVGSMWMNNSNNEGSSCSAQYYVSQDPFSLKSLKEHFEHMSIDVCSTQESVLAKHMAVALQELTAANDDNDWNKSAIIHLNYKDLQQSSPLVVRTTQQETVTPNPWSSSNVDESVLTMILLHHFQHHDSASKQQNTTTTEEPSLSDALQSSKETATQEVSNTVSSEHEIQKLIDYIRNTWKPAVLRVKTKAISVAPADGSTATRAAHQEIDNDKKPVVFKKRGPKGLVNLRRGKKGKRKEV